MSNRSWRVGIVDDSRVCRAHLRGVLEAEGDIRVVAEAAGGAEALALVKGHRLDLLVTDLMMPDVDGLEVVSRVMQEHPLPVLIVSSRPTRDGSVVFEAVRRGALDVAEKPLRGAPKAESELRAKIRRLAGVPVVRRQAEGMRVRPGSPLPTRAQQPVPSVVPRRDWVGPAPRVVGIAASAGGPLALAALLGSLPSDFPACIALVQHVPRGFTEAFADYLKGATSLAVVVCRGIVPVAPATVVVAPGDQHLVATSRSHFGLSLAGSPAEYCPCGDVLLASLATVHGPAAAGVVLSGMGQDGAAGLAHLARRDALTLVQDEPSSTVNGMPRAAERAAVAVLTPEQIAAVLIRAVLAPGQDPIRTVASGP